MAREATLSVSLTNQLKAYVLKKVETGQYESASEVVRQSLRAMQDHEEQEREYWADIRRQVKAARTAIANDDVVDGPAFMRSKIKALKAGLPSKSSMKARK